MKPWPERRCAVSPGPTTFPRGPRGCAEAAARTGLWAVGRLERRVCERQDWTVKNTERVRAGCVGVGVRETDVPVCKRSAGVGPREREREIVLRAGVCVRERDLTVSVRDREHVGVCEGNGCARV